METEPKQYKVVYTVVRRQKDGKSFWVRIGAAFPNRDGSLSVHLDAVPTNGQLQIRDYAPHDEGRKSGTSAMDDDDALPNLLTG